jgi:hypothetical protein
VAHDAARLEAQGATEVEFRWRRHTLAIPLRIEAWPLDALRQMRYIDAVDALLYRQRHQIAAGAIVDDYRDLSEHMAYVCGVGRLPETPAAPDQWFGSVPKLLRVLRDFEDDIAADLRRFWNVDYTQRFTGNLTLRQIWVYIRRSQPDSALAIADNGGREVWTDLHFATARVWEALTGKLYEGRPLTEGELARLVEAAQHKQDHVDKLKSRQAHYEQQIPANPVLAGVLAAAEQAMANRRQEIGADPDDDS